MAESDPGEVRNLYAPEDPTHREMAGALEAYREQLAAGFRDLDATASAVDREREEALLRSLGYIE